MSVLGALCSRQCARLGGLQQMRALVPGKWFTTTSCFQKEALTPGEDFWDKNKRLNRPMSPHLTIWKFELPAILSITHRATGLGMSALMSGFAIGMLALPHGFPHYYAALSSCSGGVACLFTAKFVLAFPFIFHFTNGIRHLAWDMGKGFKLTELYASGYAAVATSVILSLIAAAM